MGRPRSRSPLADARPHGRWVRDDAHAPRPLTPLTSSLCHPVSSAAWREVFAEQGLPAAGVDFASIDSWGYLRVVPLVGGAGKRGVERGDRPLPPAPLLWLLMRTLPVFRGRTRQAVRARRTDLDGRLLAQWRDVDRPSFERRARELGDADLPALDADALAGRWRSARRLLEAGIRCHFRLHPAHQLARFELVDLCERELGWSEARALELVGGCSTASTEPARALAALTARVGSGGAELRSLVERADRAAVERLRDVDAGFADAFEAHVRRYGRRTLGYELADPTLAELPELLLATVRDQAASGYDPEAAAARLAAARSALEAEARSRLTGAERARFDAVLARAQLAHGVEEENVFFTIFQPFAAARAVLLEIGDRAARSGDLDARDDVFLLRIDAARGVDEVESVVHEGVTRVLRERIEERRAALAAARAPGVRPPDVRGDAAASARPPLWALPAAIRPLVRAQDWAGERMAPPPAPVGRRHEEGVLARGLGASAGRYSGTVRVVRDEGELDRIRAGDVLVCPVTSPSWSVVFSRIGALVTDTGGMLSHPAIIAREFGLPAVLATGDATARLRDGDVVTVDGAAGLVLAADPGPAAEAGGARTTA